MALNQTAAPNVLVMVRSSGRSPKSERLGTSRRSMYSTMSGGHFLVNAFAFACVDDTRQRVRGSAHAQQVRWHERIIWRTMMELL